MPGSDETCVICGNLLGDKATYTAALIFGNKSRDPHVGPYCENCGPPAITNTEKCVEDCQEGPFTCRPVFIWKKKSESHLVTLEALLLEMQRITLTEVGIHMNHSMQEAIYSIVRDAWAAAEEVLG